MTDLLEKADNDNIVNLIKDLQNEIKSLKEEKTTKKEVIDVKDTIKNLETLKENEKVKENFIKETTIFLNELPTFLKDNKDLLPDNIDFVVDAVDSQNWDSDDTRRQELQRNIFLKASEKQDFINSLIPLHQNKVKNYLNLTAEKQRDKANELWEIYLVYLDKEKANIKKEKLERINKTGVNTDDEILKNDEYKKASEFFGIKVNDNTKLQFYNR
jgi:hypothetical protein